MPLLAPRRPYHPCYVPHDWHYWWDFGGGAFGNMGCHYLDLPFWALDLRHPEAIEADGPPPHAESTPAWQHVRYRFPARGSHPAVTLTWTHGKTPRAIFAEKDLPRWAWGAFVGTEGVLLASYTKRMLWPEEKFADYRLPASRRSLPRPEANDYLRREYRDGWTLWAAASLRNRRRLRSF